MRGMLGIALVLLTAGPAADAPAAQPVQVAIKDFAYAPPTLPGRAGARGVGVNHDEEPHTVTSRTGGFTSAGLGDGEHFSWQFDQQGTYTYFCALHPKMTATIVVR